MQPTSGEGLRATLARHGPSLRESRPRPRAGEGPIRGTCLARHGVVTAVSHRHVASGGGSTLGKIAYGALFVAGVPAALYAWAVRTEDIVPLPVLRLPPLGLLLVVAGLVSMAAGTHALIVHGGGLPMNAYPPPRFVDRGVYALIPHPLYVGFCGVVVGISLATGSASGLWLVAPTTILACTALVLGYERHDLLRRFGRASPRPALRLPSDVDAPPSAMGRLSVLVLVLLPWVAVYEAIASLGVPRDAVSTYLPGEERWPVVQSTELVYVSTYPAVVLAALVAPTQATLRRFALRGLFAMALVFPLFLAVPFIAPPRPFQPTSPFGALLQFERSIDTAACAFPSFHVVWAILAAGAFAAAWPRARPVAYGWAAAVTASSVTTGMHSVVDAIAGLLAAFAVIRARSIWDALRRGCESIAGSWHEWRFGRVRVINHGVYAAAATAVGMLIAGTLAGRGSAGAVILVALSTIVCAGLWAQLVEGSAQLLRPYGYYGGVIGIILGCIAAPLVGKPTWLMLAAASTAGPWVQSIGRLRCLVQGCCHGSPAPSSAGIRYSHPKSRVCRLADLAGLPIHPTPLYSILWNVVIALALGRLWSLHASLRLIGGLYMVLTGLGRFVEESYRGEPQTKVWAGLRLYQWIAIASVVIGVGVTMTGVGGHATDPSASWPPAVAALIVGLFAGFALGVDFPDSRRRFSRLA